MSSTHKSAMGKPVDMAGLRARNEKVRAIGNMQVNARGDVIDSNNQVVGQGTQRVNRVYNKATSAPKNKPEAVEEPTPLPIQQEAKPVENTPQPAAKQQPTIKPDPTPTPAPVEEPLVQFLEDMSEDEIEYFEDFDDIPELPPVVKSKKK
jgi:outer membrane biosynthesis protein TonB